MPSRTLRLAALMLAGISLAYWRLRHYNPYHPVLERIELPLPTDAEKLDGINIAFISDTHVGPFTSSTDVQRAVNLLSADQIDLVLLGGDYVSESNFYAKSMADALADLVERASLGGIAVLGNHDLPLGPNRVRAELERVGIRVLRNESRVVDWNGVRLAIAGIDDSIVGWADPESSFSDIPRGVPVLALWHEPDFAEESARLGAFAQLSGHTHGGQVRLPVIGPIWLPHDGKLRDTGLFEVEGMPVYVSRGLGVYRPPIRFRCPPEITLVTLRAGICGAAIR